MRIAFIVTILKKNGPVCVVNALCRVLMKRGVSIKVYYFDESEENIFPPEIPVQRIRIGSQIPFREYDVIHTHMLRSDLFMLLHWPLWRSANCRWVSTIHQETFKNQASRLGFLKAIIWTPIWYFAWLFASDVACVSKKICRQHPYRNAQVIYNGVPDVGRLEHADGDVVRLCALRRQGRIIGSCAGVVKIKGFEQIVRAMPLLPKYYWVLIGNGPELAGIKKLAIKMGVIDRCVFLGHKKDPTRYYSFFDLFALSSRSEGCCQAGLEANASGLPLVLSPLETFREIYKEGVMCEYFSFDDEKSFAQAVDKAYENRKLYGAASRALYEKSFTDIMMADKYMTVYLSN